MPAVRDAGAPRRPPVTAQVATERRVAGIPDPGTPDRGWDVHEPGTSGPLQPLTGPCRRRRRIDQAEGDTGPCCPACGRPWTDHDEAAA